MLGCSFVWHTDFAWRCICTFWPEIRWSTITSVSFRLSFMESVVFLAIIWYNWICFIFSRLIECLSHARFITSIENINLLWESPKPQNPNRMKTRSSNTNAKINKYIIYDIINKKTWFQLHFWRINQQFN